MERYSCLYRKEGFALFFISSKTGIMFTQAISHANSYADKGCLQALKKYYNQPKLVKIVNKKIKWRDLYECKRRRTIKTAAGAEFKRSKKQGIFVEAQKERCKSCPDRK